MTATIIRPKFYTVDEANARLPLLKSILRDVTDLAHELKRLHERLVLLQTDGAPDAVAEREIAALTREMDERQRAMAGYVREIAQLGAVLKDDFMGLVDFPGSIDGREVCLCYKLGEPEIAYWHEVDAGYGGRRPLLPMTRSRGSR